MSPRKIIIFPFYLNFYDILKLYYEIIIGKYIIRNVNRIDHENLTLNLMNVNG